jgi:hypothetical protein
MFNGRRAAKSLGLRAEIMPYFADFTPYTYPKQKIDIWGGKLGPSSAETNRQPAVSYAAGEQPHARSPQPH